MNLLHKWFGNRRSADSAVANDRRGGILKRTQDANARLSNAVDDLNQTLSMSRAEFTEMLRREQIKEVVIFSTYADICPHRYSPKDSLMVLCRHKGHDAHATGVAACNESLCPRLREAGK